MCIYIYCIYGAASPNPPHPPVDGSWSPPPWLWGCGIVVVVVVVVVVVEVLVVLSAGSIVNTMCGPIPWGGGGGATRDTEPYIHMVFALDHPFQGLLCVPKTKRKS